MKSRLSMHIVASTIAAAIAASFLTLRHGLEIGIIAGVGVGGLVALIVWVMMKGRGQPG